MFLYLTYFFLIFSYFGQSFGVLWHILYLYMIIYDIFLNIFILSVVCCGMLMSYVNEVLFRMLMNVFIVVRQVRRGVTWASMTR